MHEVAIKNMLLAIDALTRRTAALEERFAALEERVSALERPAERDGHGEPFNARAFQRDDNDNPFAGLPSAGQLRNLGADQEVDRESGPSTLIGWAGTVYADGTREVKRIFVDRAGQYQTPLPLHSHVVDLSNSFYWGRDPDREYTPNRAMDKRNQLAVSLLYDFFVFEYMARHNTGIFPSAVPPIFARLARDNWHRLEKKFLMDMLSDEGFVISYAAVRNWSDSRSLIQE